MIIVKYPSYKDKDVSISNLLRQDRNSSIFIDRIIAEYKDERPKINTIEIETINRCNNDCSFCPVNRNDDTREYRKMDSELFYNLINQLEEQQYDGHLSLFSNNEPLIDVRIYEFLEYAYKKLPNATHILYTNGLILDEEKYNKIIKYLDYLVIDNYSDDLTLLPNVEAIVNNHKGDICNCKTAVLVRKKTQILSSRGGTAPNRDVSNLRFSSGCILPFMQMIIRPDGKVSKCCQDALGKTTIGDLSKISIQELWESNEYSEFRDSMICKGRDSIELCSKCDLFGLTNYFPEYWISKGVQVLADIAWDKRRKENKKIYVYDQTKTSKKVVRLLALHGLKVDGILFNNDIEKLNLEKSFIIFPSYENDIFDRIDPLCELVGKSYLIYEDINSSLHTEFIDEDVNKELDNFINFLTAIKTKKVVVFGTGFSAIKICKTFHIEPAYYIDNNKTRWGTEMDGIKIDSPNVLKEENTQEIAVVIGSLKYKEMYDQLVNEDICSPEVIWDGLQYADLI
ncbi:radical SAM/SPASM domain-containing protein [Anaeromicropila herbilytica]|uniref:Radical SAM protein n=1 Tax=Anaeromicropila herbilytica TaxID=2785025 RepID=A0A7R7EPD1_9FIRM|nr:radical SAM/SPASM domain-containing protein [Anaeromicropila herbilytica]BCN32544.1 hypothetical protein bsdtb5_38390 [Anaeromicropila herbilytica]